MLLQPLFEFSRTYCVAICSVLVPANLLTTIAILVLVIQGQPIAKILWLRTTASVLAIALFLHISTWFIIGVVTPVTFILFGLGSTCLCVDLIAVAKAREVRLLSSKLLSPLT